MSGPRVAREDFCGKMESVKIVHTSLESGKSPDAEPTVDLNILPRDVAGQV